MNHLSSLSVLVLGLGDSGLAMARWCARHGASVQVWDSRAEPPQAGALRAAAPGATLRSGDLGPDDLAGVDLVLKSPGLAPADARVAPLLQAAAARGTAVAGELELFARALADLKTERGYAPRVLAITGTNGKTTTTAMCAQLVARCGLRVAMAGNIGPTLLDTLSDALDREPAPPAEPAPGSASHPPIATGSSVAAGQAAGAVLAPQADSGDSADSADSGEGTDRAEPADDTGGDDANASAQLPPEPPAAGPEHDDAPLQPLAAPAAAAPVFEVLPEVWVLELSSFQLHGVRGFEPDAAVVLNLSQDHLDWHGSLAAYAQDKARIYGEQAVMVVNRDDLAVEAMVPAPVLLKPAARGQRARTVSRQVLRFGLDAPQQPGDFGLVTENGMAWLVRARELDETVKRRKGEDDELVLQRLMPADALRVRGRHNAANALAALALACAIGCPLAPMLHGLRDYAGEPHRVEYIGTVAGVEAFDDSKGTNVGATVAALDGLGADKAPAKLVVILGGDGKGQDFSPLVAPLQRHARAVALIGRDGPALGALLAGLDLPVATHGSLEAATAWCFSQARAGDAVLLSPACASLDMFRNYAHRAEVFVAAVQAHAADQGEALL